VAVTLGPRIKRKEGVMPFRRAIMFGLVTCLLGLSVALVH